MDSIQEYNNYFEGIATSHVSIQHGLNNEKRFASVNIDEVLSGESIDFNYNAHCAMVLNPYEFNYFDNQDTIGNNRTGGFWIIKHVDPYNYVERNQVIDLCESVVKDIASKLLSDKVNGVGLQYVDMNSYKGYMLSNVLDSAYGWAVSFNFAQPIDAQIDPIKWL